VQHLASSGEMVLPFDLWKTIDAAGAGRLTLRERFEAKVKGVEHPRSISPA
jgi:hypothetical protein